MRFCLIIFCLIGTLSLSAQDWKFRKSKNDVDVYFRESEDSKVKELRMVGKVESSLTAALLVISDIERFPEWVYNCKEAKIIGGDFPREFDYYNVTDFPWPLTDRQFVLRCTTYQNPETGVVTTESFAQPDAMPEDDRYVRVSMVHSRWDLKPLEDGMIEATYYLKADPGGSIPSFLINWALDIGPRKSLQKLRKRVQLEEYRLGRLAFISE